jgi:hypothetical protein
MADTHKAMLLNVLRRVAQIEDGLEDAPLEEDATHQCQRLGWLDDGLQLTPAGREVLEKSNGGKQA